MIETSSRKDTGLDTYCASSHRKHPAATHQHLEVQLGVCPVSPRRPDGGSEQVLQRQPQHFHSAALRASFTEPAAKEGAMLALP